MSNAIWAPLSAVTSGTSISDNTVSQTALEESGMSKDDFLMLLTKQLQFQDPLEPMKNEDFVAELAQFSSLEQMTNVNELLEQSLEDNLYLSQSINNSMATNLLGKKINSLNNFHSHTAGQTSTFSYKIELPSGSTKTDSTVIRIYNEDGNLVRTDDIGGQFDGEQFYVWDGKDDDGNLQNSGNYLMQVESTDANGDEIPSYTSDTGLVTGISYESGSAVLLVGDAKVPLGNVIEIIDP